ncbi:hypothetical protein DL95DRAFT_407587 [Leptodontidium sp. 2 PMI_412]|nr:hypothetical protein DL95DRAFT_407587 [Leptodontidium sp. 2 PMI_412]
MATQEPKRISTPIPIPIQSLVGPHPSSDYILDTASISPRSVPIVPFPLDPLPIHQNAPTEDQQKETNDMWAKELQDRANAVDNHVKWLQSPDKRDWKERTAWIPSSNISYDPIIQDIQWGSSTSTTASEGPVDLFATHHTIAHSDSDSQAEYINNLTHVELDVEGNDATGSRIRVQRILEVNLKVHHNNAMSPVTEETTMEFKRTLVLKSPARYSLLALRPGDREPYHDMLTHMAQHEVDKALDERNHYLREVFGRDVDHLRTRREGEFGDGDGEGKEEGEGGEHNWNYQKPEIGVRGQDGTVLHLVERRSDAVVEGEVILSHVVSVMQIRCGGRNRLFDLPTEGTDEERRVRKARWSVSSAIDRCVADESADRVVIDKWVDGTFLPRQ